MAELRPSNSPVPDAERDHVYQQLCKVWGLWEQPSKHNPCAQAVPLQREAMASHDAADFLVTAKTDGVRFQLLLTTRPDGRPISVMVGRDMSMYEIETMAPENFYADGTLLDGELAWRTHRDYDRTLSYVAFDAMTIAGRAIGRQPLVERLYAVSRCVGLTDDQVQAVQDYTASQDDGDPDLIAFILGEDKVVATPNNHGGLSLTTKPMLPVPTWAAKLAAEGITSESAALAAATGPDDRGLAVDGLVFTPSQLPVYVNTHRSLFKWKPSDRCTVDVFMRAGRPLVRATGSDALTELRAVEGAPVTAPVARLADGVYECAIELRDDTVYLEPRLRRHDRREPNTAATVAGTLRSKQQNVTIADIVAWCAPAQ